MSGHLNRVPVPAAAAHAEAADAAGPAPAAPTPAAPQPVAGLTVGHADDPAEHHADRLADQALERLRTSASEPGTDGGGERHAHTPGCGHLRRSVAPSSSAGATIGAEGGVLDGEATGRIEAARGSGAPLPTGVRRRMEAGFGRGLGHVRVHDGPQAASLSAAMSAEAFTTGSDIFFGAGRFAPETPQGERVLAHEIAHVLTEPAGVRRLFGLGKKKTPEEKAAKEARKAEEARKAAAVKQSKKTETAELKALAESRKEGVAGRAALQEAIYDESGDAPVAVAGKVDANGHVRTAASGPQQRVASIHEEFEAALLREKEIFEELAANHLGGSDEQRASLAYTKVWFEEYPHLKAVRPPRETAAERLVIQVRHARSEAAAAGGAQEADAKTLKTVMLPKAVEMAYEQMVTDRDELLANKTTRSRAVAQEKAWEAVREKLPPKTLAGFPPKDGPLDAVAWERAEERVKARTAQKKRDGAAIEASLALLPETQRIGPQPQESSLAAKTATVGKVEGYVELGGKAATVVGGGIAGKVGSGQDAALREAQGITKNEELGSGLPSFLDQGVGGAMTAGERADKQLRTGQRDWVDQDLPESDATKVSTGFGQVTGILNGLMSAVSSAFQMVTSIKASWENKDPYEGLKAAKAGATGLDGLVASAKNAADLAKLIDSGVADGVAKVVPGLDIAATALAMVKGIMDVATTGMRQRETDLTMFEARAGSTDKVNVMVYPLMKVSQVYTKQLEKTCWALGVSILNFSTSVAQVASGGGFGIPAAIKAATTVVDNLHNIAHYIASKVLGVMAKRAEKESAVLHLEGGAEDELRRHPKMAVDGIIMKAAAGDQVALMFLRNYRIDGKPITQDYVKRIKPKPVKAFDPTKQKSDPTGKDQPAEQTSDDALLLKIRAAVLEGMGTNADPKSVFEDLKAKANPVLSKLSAVKDAWTESGKLATDRNTLAAEGRLGDNTTTNRGLGWRIKQMLASSNRGKLQQKTAAFGAVEKLPPGIVCVVGDLTLPDGASPPQIAKFVESLTVEAIEEELARSARRNSPEWIAFLRDALVAKITAQAAAAATANAATP